MSVVGAIVVVTRGEDMSTTTAERPTAPQTSTTQPPEDVDRDGIEVYCPDMQSWARTWHFFCEGCGATDHDLS